MCNKCLYFKVKMLEFGLSCMGIFVLKMALKTVKNAQEIEKIKEEMGLKNGKSSNNL